MGFDREQYLKDCRRLRFQLRRAIAPALDHASRLLADEIRRLCPVDTGELRDSVTVKKVRVARGRIVQDVSVGSGMENPHAAQVEYGTHDASPVPFIRSAADATEPEMVRIITRAIASAQ